MSISYNPLTPLSHNPHTDTVRQRLKTQVEFNNKYQKFNATAPTFTVQLSKIQKLNKKNQNIHTVIHSYRLSEIAYQTHSHSERKRERESRKTKSSGGKRQTKWRRRQIRDSQGLRRRQILCVKQRQSFSFGFGE